MSVTTVSELNSLLALLLPGLPHPQRDLRRLQPTQHHGAKRRSHTVTPIQLTELHAAKDQSRHNFARALDNGVFRCIHVEWTHATQRDSTHTRQTLRAESAKRPVVARRADDEGGVDRVGVHAAVLVVVLGDERPVGHDAGDADLTINSARDEVFDAGGVEELDVRLREDRGEERAHEVAGVFDDDVVAFVVVGDAEVVCGLGGLLV